MDKLGAQVVRKEAEALQALAERLEGAMRQAFLRAVELLFQSAGRVIVTGIGKSGIVGRKIAATLSSTGTPALFLHPAEALHGDLGMIVRGDTVIALSASGETEEILRLLATLKRLGVPLISLTCDAIYSGRQRRGSTGRRPRLSTLAGAANVALDCSIAREACSLGLAPTASTTAMMALGDALAVALAERHGFKEEDFARLHPGGKLGKQLALVSELMHTGHAVPRVAPETRMPDVIYEMSRKRLGVTTVVKGTKLADIISDGDLRRLLERSSRKRARPVLELTAAECMTTSPRSIAPDEFATAALRIMEEGRITSLPVVDAHGTLLGIVHLHDLWGTEMV
ncbi:MAG: KpsF/GutQ family sugar-phosphate isomerase [Acidobacteria bacterium]|nr:KpsF/GutQ family sugar-phosphate isomerase [Acidobacteriota bacterium]